MKGRFAPSPSGRMHLGNVYAALISWLSIRQKGGSWVLRIEDIDTQRSKQEFADQIRRDLEWLGLTWDEEYTQSQRFDIYAEHLTQLRRQQLTYPCYCTRADIMATQAPHESDGRVVYKGTCRHLSNSQRPDTPAATRIIVPDKDITFVDGHYGTQTVNLVNQCGDFILQRKDGAWAYQLAVVVDDALMGVTEVVRGRDLLLSVPQQQYLYECLGYQSPEFIHIPLITNPQGQRLCKRDKSLDMGELRKHHTANDIIGMIAYHTGIIDCYQPISAEELIGNFDWNKIPTTDIVMSTSI